MLAQTNSVVNTFIKKNMLSINIFVNRQHIVILSYLLQPFLDEQLQPAEHPIHLTPFFFSLTMYAIAPPIIAITTIEAIIVVKVPEAIMH